MTALAIYNYQPFGVFKPPRKIVTAICISVSFHLVLFYVLDNVSWRSDVVAEREPQAIEIRLTKTQEQVSVIKEDKPLPSVQKEVSAIDQNLAAPLVRPEAPIVPEELLRMPQNTEDKLFLDLSVPQSPLQETDTQWVFSGAYKQKIQARNETRTRSKMLAVNTHQRTGQSETELAGSGLSASNSTIVRSGDVCLVKYTRQVGERGNKYALGSVACPGTRPWWLRENLDEVATYRRIP